MLDCLVNGEISRLVPVSDRGLQYGDGVFETIAVFQGRPRFWQLHMDRLSAGCEALGLTWFPQPLLLREVQTVAAGQARCVVKIIVTRGEAGRGYAPPGAMRCTRIISAHEYPEYEPAGEGCGARICDLRLAIQPALAGIKHLNRLEQVLARREWTDPAIQEGILLDPEDHVISGIAGNLFLVFGGRLLTPRLDRCGVRGVMRAAILQAFRDRSEQRRIKLDMLPEADEVILCNSVRGILPVQRIGHWEFPVGPLAQELQQWLAQQ